MSDSSDPRSGSRGHSDIPPKEAHEPRGSSAPPPFDDQERTPLERILPELLKRGLEAGRGVSGSLLSKDVTGAIAAQLVDVRAGVVTAVAQEVGRFLRSADVASEIRKVLVGLNIEANVQLKFSERDDGSIQPDVKVEADAGRSRRARGRSEPPEQPTE